MDSLEKRMRAFEYHTRWAQTMRDRPPEVSNNLSYRDFSPEPNQRCSCHGCTLSYCRSGRKPEFLGNITLVPRTLRARLLPSSLNSVILQVERFCDSQLDPESRALLVQWLRDTCNPMSPEVLKIKFSFSIPSEEAIETIATFAPKGVVSAGAGTGYWAYLLRSRLEGRPVIAFDANDAYPEGLRYVDIVTAGPEFLSGASSDLGLLLAWPDDRGAHCCLCLPAVGDWET